jgi:hypothetical protein
MRLVKRKFCKTNTGDILCSNLGGIPAVLRFVLIFVHTSKQIYHRVVCCKFVEDLEERDASKLQPENRESKWLHYKISVNTNQNTRHHFQEIVTFAPYVILNFMIHLCLECVKYI